MCSIVGDSEGDVSSPVAGCDVADIYGFHGQWYWSFHKNANKENADNRRRLSVVYSMPSAAVSDFGRSGYVGGEDNTSPGDKGLEPHAGDNGNAVNGNKGK